MRTARGGFKKTKKSIRSTGTVAPAPQISTAPRPVRRSNAWRFYGEFKPLEPLDAGIKRTVARGRGLPIINVGKYHGAT